MEPSDFNAIPVTTEDLRTPYDILGQVYVQVANRAEFSSHLQILRAQYAEEINAAIDRGQIGSWGAGMNETEDVSGQIDFEHAFFIAVRELQKRAALMGADAIIGMRQDIDISPEYSQYFFLQMYGTAVRSR